MISFIVIGRNIQNTIALCIESVLRFAEVNNIPAYEILYVDSNSDDDSLSIAQQYFIRTILVTGEVNAAIARNAGAKYSKGSNLFFVDGDMELIPQIYKYVFDNKTHQIRYPFVSGYLHHKYYNEEFKYLYSEEDELAEKPIYMNFSRGLLIVTRDLWERLGGMDERLVRNQDLDFGLRMAQIGFPAKHYNHLMATHHTISYFEKSRFLYFLKSKALLSPGLLMRKHLFCRAYLERYFKNVIYVFILLGSFLLLPYKPMIGALLLLIYFLIQLGRAVKNINTKVPLFRPFLFKALYGFYMMIGFLFYFPNSPIYDTVELSNPIK